MRDGALGHLIEEMKQKKPHVEKKRTLIEGPFGYNLFLLKLKTENTVTK